MSVSVEFDIAILDVALSLPDRHRWGPLEVCGLYNIMKWIFVEGEFESMIGGSLEGLDYIRSPDTEGVSVAFKFDRFGSCILNRQFDQGFDADNLDLGGYGWKTTNGRFVHDVLDYSPTPVPITYRKESFVSFCELGFSC